jgi:hypothetical protein
MDVLASGALLEPCVQGNQIPADNLDLPPICDIFIAAFRAGCRPWVTGETSRALPGLDRILGFCLLLALFSPI